MRTGSGAEFNAIVTRRGLLGAALNPAASPYERRQLRKAAHDAQRMARKHKED